MTLQLSGLTRILRASIAPFLLLITPFASYLQFNRLGVTNPEVILAVLAIVAVALVLGAVSTRSPALTVVVLAALLTFFIDIQAREPGLKRLGLAFIALSIVLWLLRRHAARIVSLMMATVLALSFVPSRSQAASRDNMSNGHGTAAGRADLPLVVHVLMDEYIGPEGIPVDLAPEGFKQQFESFYVDRGFRLFGKAYSEYPKTMWSIPELLNLSPTHFVPGLMSADSSDNNYHLARNDYFERLARLGYIVRVHQSTYIDVCPDNGAAACRTYSTSSLDMLPRLNVPVATKLAIIGGTFLGQSEAYSRTKEKYQTTRLRLQRVHIPLPKWNWEQGTPAPVGTMPMFDAVAEELSKAQRGTFVFAHFLLPHYPYVYNASCEQPRASTFLNRNDYDRANVPGGIMNVPEGRAERYRGYFQQMLCAQKKLDGLIAAIPPSLRQDAIIIVQGDHGSRISLVDPTTVAKVEPSASDYADMFSTLFAVRSPSIEHGYDTRLTPITCLLRSLVQSDFRSVSGTDTCSSPNIVFFMGSETPQPRPLLDFWTAAGAKQSAMNAAGR
ncbi:MAG TPA: sulfatase-like hydrolase/transferase [Vicinamibacterales bacterium]|nr:sulfatase-like hydrolase/transferase [Vicinamibacterales bacterium]